MKSISSSSCSNTNSNSISNSNRADRALVAGGFRLGCWVPVLWLLGFPCSGCGEGCRFGMGPILMHDMTPLSCKKKHKEINPVDVFLSNHLLHLTKCK